MMRRHLTEFTRVMGAVALLVLGGCAHTAPTNFYVLTPLPSSDIGTRAMTAADGPAVGLGPLTMPSYLDRPQMVTRSGQARLNLGEFDHWAAPLQDSVLHVLAENLSILIPTDRVTTYPWPRTATLDYQISLDMLRFDGVLGGDVVLLARWRILDKDGKERLMKKSYYHAASGSQDYEAMANTLSRMLESLSREMATALNLTRARP
jgi:uncharacterized lipoprotein YmbA